MSTGFIDAATRVPFRSVPARTSPATAKFVRLSQLRKLRGSEQVAAICFRVREGRIEFLLVRTRGGRWTFPKGSAEPGLTYAQAAALEAFEEAGVHGRMEETSFSRYVRGKSNAARHSARSVDIVVNAHLCEVLWLEPPQETNREPTWFPAEQAKRRLREDRECSYGTELAGVVDHAVIRIQRLAQTKWAALNLSKVRCIEEGRDISSLSRGRARKT